MNKNLPLFALISCALLASGVAHAGNDPRFPDPNKPRYGSSRNDTIVSNPYEGSSAKPEVIIRDLDRLSKEANGGEAIEAIMAAGSSWGNTLASMGPRATAPILDALQNKDVHIQTKHILVWVLSISKDLAAAPAMRKLLTDAAQPVALRAGAAGYLAAIDDKQSMGKIESMIQGVNVDTTTQLAVSCSVAQAGWSNITFLRKMAGLDNATWATAKTRTIAIQALGKSNNADTVNILLEITAKYPKDFAYVLRSDDADVANERNAMLQALTLKRHPNGSKFLADILRQIPDPGRTTKNEEKTTMLRDPDKYANDEARRALVQALSETGGDDAVTALIERLQDSKPIVVVDAVKGLRKINDPRAYPAVDALVSGLPRDPRFADMFDTKTGKPKPTYTWYRDLTWARDDLKKAAKK